MFDKKTDPSYGIIGISRVSCGGVSLFGTEIKSDSYIELTIKRAEYCRDHHNDWYFGYDPLITIALTNNQFSNMIAGMNCGDGIPCTIRSFKTDTKIEHYKYPEPEAKQDVFKKEYNEHIATSLQHLKDLDSAIEESGLSNVKKTSLKNRVSNIYQDMTSNSKFLKDQFSEFVDLSLNEAKNEIDHHIESRIKDVGLQAMKNTIGDNGLNGDTASTVSLNQL